MSPFRAKLLGFIVLSSSRPTKQGANFKTLESKTCSHSCSGTKSHILMCTSLKTLKWPTQNIGNELHYRLTYRLVEHETYDPFELLVLKVLLFFCTPWNHVPYYTMMFDSAWIMHNSHTASQLCILIIVWNKSIYIKFSCILKLSLKYSYFGLEFSPHWPLILR
jgi:hypothetical protein